MTWMRSTCAHITRLLRRYRPDRNPLRRRSDRIEAVLVVVALAALLLALWPALSAGRALYRDGLAAERVGPGARRQVTAVLLADAPRYPQADGHRLPPRVEARWTPPGGEPRTGQVPAPAGTRAGAQVRIWVDDDGMPTTPPQHRAETVARAVTAAFMVMVGAAVVVMTLLGVGRLLLDRGRYREWDAAWAAADHRWRRSRP